MFRVDEIKRALKCLSSDELKDITEWSRLRIIAVRKDHATVELAATETGALPPYVTLDEYFAFEDASEFKHEYVNGALYAISGPSADQVRITRELLVAFATHLPDGPCEALASNPMLRIHLDESEIVYRPDLVVVGNKEDWRKHSMCNPKLIVEIPSPSTGDIDRREKVTTYKHAESVEEYAIVEQDEYRVTVHRRADGWIIPEVYSGPEAVADFRSIALRVPLRQIYTGTSAVTTLDEIKRAVKQVSLEELEDLIDWLYEFGDLPSSAHMIREPRPALKKPPPPSMSLPPSPMTMDDYFELAKASPMKYEYINGVVYAMSGGPSLIHCRITVRLTAAFETHLRKRPCQVFNSDANLRIYSEKDQIFYRPDLTVACNKKEWGTHHVCNPKLVIEVLSPSTEHIDRREKAMSYRRIASVEEYVLVEQDEHKIIVHRRAEGWKPQQYVGPEAVAEFRSVALAIPLEDIYADILQTA